MHKEELEKIYSIVKSKNIPILVLDEKWHTLFKDKDKTPRIAELEKRLNDALKKQGQVTNDLKELRKLKAKLIEGVVANMETLDSDPKKQKINAKNQKLIVEANEKIEALEDEELEMPRIIREANVELMIECVTVSYDRIKKNKADIELLNRWINEMRIELKKKLLIKQDKEMKNSDTYAYLHDIFGQEIMEIFDKSDEEKT